MQDEFDKIIELSKKTFSNKVYERVRDVYGKDVDYNFFKENVIVAKTETGENIVYVKSQVQKDVWHVLFIEFLIFGVIHDMPFVKQTFDCIFSPCYYENCN